MSNFFQRITALIVLAVMVGAGLSLVSPAPAQAADPVYILENDRLCLNDTNCQTFKYSSKSSKKAPMAFASTNHSCTDRESGHPVLHDNVRRGQRAFYLAQAQTPINDDHPEETYPVRWETFCFPHVKGWKVTASYYNRDGQLTGKTTVRIKRSRSGRWIDFNQWRSRDEIDHGAKVVVRVTKIRVRR